MIVVKVEALNIYGFVYAARDLGANRGAGLSLLGMPKALEDWIAAKYRGVRRITSGASKAALLIEDMQANAGDVDKEVREWLVGQYSYATIAVACADLKVDEKVLDVEENLQCRIRMEQMQSFSFARPAKVEGGRVCKFDHVRPASRETQRGAESYWVSEEVYEFRKKGYDLKREFLGDHAGKTGADWTYTRDLTDLTTNPGAGRLNKKMAIFYADGNGFGSKPRAALAGLESEGQIVGMEEFDKAVQGRREEFLRQLLIKTGERHWQTDKGERRIEVLLWGGDELMLAVPAWCGWETAELFASKMKDSTAPLNGNQVPLKYAMGLIFAHHKAPIHPLVQLVKKLAEVEAKGGKDLQNREGRVTHRLSYLVLESFDHVGEDLEGFRALQWRNKEATKGLVLSAEQNNLERMSEALAGLKSGEFPRRKVYEAVKGLNQGKSWELLNQDIEPFVSRSEWSDALTMWRTATGSIESSWFHLVDLWDYVAPELQENAAEGVKPW
jgi:hypothetical protein